MKKSSYLKLAISLAVPLFAGFLGSLFTTPAIPEWYATLSKPAFTPPAWLFGPVWTALYLLMGAAAFLVWRKGYDRREVKIALGVFLAQLILNVAWSAFFFGLRSPGLAFVEILLLLAAIFATFVYFSKVSRLAAWLLIPYLLWVSFAAVLNYSIWSLSRSAPEAVVCAEDVRLCPDDSFVSRIAPTCEFAACPGGVSLKTFTDGSGNSFEYPDGFGKLYVDAFLWPPELKTSSSPFSCIVRGSESSLSGKTELRNINGRDYCVTVLSEKGEDSDFYEYVYSFPEGESVVDLRFSVNIIRCSAVSESEKPRCEAEHSSFDVNRIIGQLAESVRLTQDFSR